MTVRLYYTDPYLAEFTATVISVEDRRVYLDRSAFYPTSGGQPFDTGEIAGAAVVDVIDEDTRIAHLLAEPPVVTAGAPVAGRIDWNRRFDHMQQHTGQHLLSALFEELFGHRTVSVHFGAVYSTLDLDAESVPRDEVVRVEGHANAVVLEHRPVNVTFEDAATATGLRKPPDRAGEIRIVTIDGLDRSACGGTHVRDTGAIGPVFVRRIEKHKKMSRVEFLCGNRALAQARGVYELLSGLAATMKSGIPDLPALVEAQGASLRTIDAERRKLADELSRQRARSLYDSAPLDAAGMRRIAEHGQEVDELRAIAQALSAMPRVMFIGTVASPPTIVFAASDDSGVNAGAALKTVLAALGGRGGGSPRAAQGTVPDTAALDVAATELAKLP
jgi:alanyl-tRNA synthetase